VTSTIEKPEVVSLKMDMTSYLCRERTDLD